MPRYTKGLGKLRRRKKNGREVGAYFFKFDGRRITTPYRDKTAAEKWRVETLADIERGLRQARPDRTTMDDLFDLVVADYKRHNRSGLSRLESRLSTHLRPALGGKLAASLKTDHVEEYTDSRMIAGPQNATINRELETLRRALNIGQQWEPPKVVRPPKIEMLPQDNARQGFLEPEQYSKLRDSLEEPIKLLYILAYHIGARCSALLALEWDRVDIKSGLIRPPANQPRNKRIGTWPIYGDMLPALQAAQIVHERDWPNVKRVIHRAGRPVVDYRDAWDKGVALSGLDTGLLFHDLRRSAARNLRRADLSEHECMQIMGHKTASMFRRYAIIDERDVQRQAATLGAWAAKNMKSGTAETAQKEPVN